MLTVSDLADLTDPATIGRGRAYARQDRVEVLERRPAELLAEVRGTEIYHVRIGDGTWWCDCPVGSRGALCKHCVAVVVDAEEDRHGAEALPPGHRTAPPTHAPEPPATSPEPSPADIAALRAEVEDTLAPRRRFYEYGQANRYAREAEPLLRLLARGASRPSEDLLDVVERAVALTVRTILRSDDSSGAQGDQIRRLLDLHADVASGLAASLSPKRRRALARWLHRFAFSGQQDVFEVDVDRYAAALGESGVAEYRRLVEESARATGADAFAVRYARGRLAVLDRDPDRIVAVIGEGLHTQWHVLAVVEALDDAGLTEHAVRHAEASLHLPHTPHATALVQRLVDDAASRGDLARVLELRRDAFRRDPGSRTLSAYRKGAQSLGTWATEAAAAEQHLAANRPWEWVGTLLAEGRDEEAWAFAVAHPEAPGSLWDALCARRARTAPEETIPHYERLVTEALLTTGRQGYRAAARLLVRLRAVCVSAGESHMFAEFMAATAEANRRRPTCIDELVRAGLIRPDRSVVDA